MTDVDVCPKCGRPRVYEEQPSYRDVCAGEGSYECDIAAESYRRGLRDGARVGVEIGRDVIMEHIHVGKRGRAMWFSCEPDRGRYATGKRVMYPDHVIDRFLADEGAIDAELRKRGVE